MHKAMIEFWKTEFQVVRSAVPDQLPKFSLCIDVHCYIAPKGINNLKVSVQDLFTEH